MKHRAGADIGQLDLDAATILAEFQDAARYSSGVRIVARIHGSWISAILTTSGMSQGLKLALRAIGH